MEGAAAAKTVLSGIVNATMLQGVLGEITGILPVVIPVLVTFIAVRKGIAFLQSVLHSA